MALGLAEQKHPDEKKTALRKAAFQLRHELTKLREEDARVFERVAEALRMARTSDAERIKRRAALDAALKEAARPPLEVRRHAAAIIQLAREVMPHVMQFVRPDVRTAEDLAKAAGRAAAESLQANLEAIEDGEVKREVQAEADAVAHLLAEAANLHSRLG